MTKTLIRIEKITFNGIKDLQKAKDLLAKANQRKRRSRQVTKLAQKYLRGEWKEGMDPPWVLTVSGELKAGQHRLEAWIVAVAVDPNLCLSFDIKYNVPDDYAYAAQCDEIPVTSEDALRIAGLDGNIGRSLKLFLNRGISIGRPIMEEIIEAAKPYQDVLRFAIKHTQGKKLATAPVIAAGARAKRCVVKDDDLLRFLDIYCRRTCSLSTAAPSERSLKYWMYCRRTATFAFTRSPRRQFCQKL